MAFVSNVGNVSIIGIIDNKINMIGNVDIGIVACYTITIAFEAIIKANGHLIWDKSKVE